MDIMVFVYPICALLIPLAGMGLLLYYIAQRSNEKKEEAKKDYKNY